MITSLHETVQFEIIFVMNILMIFKDKNILFSLFQENVHYSFTHTKHTIGTCHYYYYYLYYKINGYRCRIILQYMYNISHLYFSINNNMIDSTRQTADAISP